MTMWHYEVPGTVFLHSPSHSIPAWLPTVAPFHLWWQEWGTDSQQKKLHIYTVLCGGASYKALFWQHINQDYLGRHEQPLSFFHWWLGQHLWWWQCIDLTEGTLALPAFLYTISDMTKKSCTQYYEHCNTTLLPNWMLCFLTDCIKTIWLYLNKSLI